MRYLTLGEVLELYLKVMVQSGGKAGAGLRRGGMPENGDALHEKAQRLPMNAGGYFQGHQGILEKQAQQIASLEKKVAQSTAKINDAVADKTAPLKATIEDLSGTHGITNKQVITILEKLKEDGKIIESKSSRGTFYSKLHAD